MPDFVKYKIKVNSHKQFSDTLTVLFAKGFVFSNIGRYKTIEDVKTYWGLETWWKYIVIGTDSECSRVLHGNTYCDKSCQLITLADFLKSNY